MVQSMPCGVFKWIEPEDFKLENDTNNSKEGHILEVDLEYPKELHDLHNEYPYCPKHMSVKDEMLSEYCKVVWDKNSVKCGKLTKLIPTLYNKEKYIVHARNLKQAVDAGLVLKRIHRVLEFEQKPWMKEYIDFNTEKRKLAENDFEKNFFKLMNNSVFGKTMENVRKRRNFKLICDENKLEKYSSKHTFINGIIFNENLVGGNYVQENLKLNKPIYVGFSILDISKTLMYDFHYNFIKNKYGDRARLLFTDTDSLCYELETKPMYKDMYDNKEMFDLSDVKGKYNDFENKKVSGKFKPEYANSTIREFIGLRSKMYSVKLDDENEDKKAKGIVKSVIKKDLKHEMYNKILTTSGRMYSRMKVIRSQKHRVYTMDINKISLSAFDDKRYLLEDGISSYAYGHYKSM